MTQDTFTDGITDEPIEVDVDRPEYGRESLVIRQKTGETEYGLSYYIIRDVQRTRGNLNFVMKQKLDGGNEQLSSEIRVPSDRYLKEEELEKTRLLADQYLEENPEDPERETIEQFVADINEQLNPVAKET